MEVVRSDDPSTPAVADPTDVVVDQALAPAFDEAISHIYLAESAQRQGYETLGQTARAVVGG